MQTRMDIIATIANASDKNVRLRARDDARALKYSAVRLAADWDDAECETFAALDNARGYGSPSDDVED